MNNQLCDELQNDSIDAHNTFQLPGSSCSYHKLIELHCDEVLMTPTVTEIPICASPNSDPTQEIFDTSPNVFGVPREDSPSLISSLPCLQPNAESNQETPSKFLQECSPIPTVPIPLHKRGKQSAAVLTSKENFAIKINKGKLTPNIPCKGRALKKTVKKRLGADLQDTDTSATCDSDNLEENETHVQIKKKKEKRAKKLRGKELNKTPSTNTIQRPVRIVQKRKQITKVPDEDTTLTNLSNSSENASNECVECFEKFEETQSTVDWVQRVICKKWLHETCTMYGDYCNPCQGKKQKHNYM